MRPDLDALEAAEKAARRPPWSVLYGCNVIDADGGSAFSKISNIDPTLMETNDANAALVVALRNAAPALIARARLAERMAEALRDALRQRADSGAEAVLREWDALNEKGGPGADPG